MKKKLQMYIYQKISVEAFCKEIGADFYTADAARCAEVAAAICSGRQP